MIKLASLVGITAAILVTDYLAIRVNGSRLDRYPLKNKNNEDS